MENRILAPNLPAHIGGKINVSTLTGTKPLRIDETTCNRLVWETATYNGATLLGYDSATRMMRILSARGKNVVIHPLEVWKA